MFVRVFWLLARVGCVFALFFLFTKGWGLLLWNETIANPFFDAANAIGIYGDEALLDFYIDVTATLSFLASIVIVALAHRWWKRRAARQVDLAAE